MRVTPHAVETIYEALRALPPFSRWGLPHVDQVVIHVVPRYRRKFQLAEGGTLNGRPYLSVRAHDYTGQAPDLHALTVTIAHEAVHIAQVLAGEKPLHGATFQRRARSACRAMGWDLKTF